MPDLVGALARLPLPGIAHCRVPADLEPISDVGEEADPRDAGTSGEAIESLWQRFCALYRAGVHPGMQLCVRRHGVVAIDRSIGHARGNAPGEGASSERVVMTTRTPVNLFSAAKAITAMVIHKLDEQRVSHLDDRVCEYVPGFERDGKDRITIRHLVSHKAGIPNLPPGAFDLDLLQQPELLLELLCEMRPRSRPGQLLAYHAVSSGFVLAELVQRATGQSLREVLAKQIREPLGLEWLHYGVEPKDVPRVAQNALTGPPVLPPISTLLRGAIGVDMAEAVRLSNDPRFLTAIIPSANVISTARDVSAFYQCLLNGGELDGTRVFEARTVHHAVDEQTGLEIDLTLMLPIAYSMGFMLGSPYLSLYGWNHPEAFGHLGLSNVFTWADPERDLVVALLTTGKPVISLHALRLVQLLSTLHDAFPPVSGRRR